MKPHINRAIHQSISTGLKRMERRTAAYKTAISKFSLPLLYDEKAKLENSLRHLRRSNEELRAHAETIENDRQWVESVIVENEGVIARQEERIEIVNRELSERRAENKHENDTLSDATPNGSGNLSNGHSDRMEEDASNGTEMEVDEAADTGQGLHL